MKILICLLTPQESLQIYFGRGKDSIIPRDALLRGPFVSQQPQITIVSWKPKPKAELKTANLEHFVLKRLRDHDACILILDNEWENYAINIRNATFVATFDANCAKINPQNFFFKLFARTLRNFAQLDAKFKRGNDRNLLALPLRNFKANELQEIVQLCRDESLAKNLSDQVESRIAKLRKCVRPRRNSNYRTKYAVDKLGRFFVFGPERHSNFATGTPHTPACEIAGRFRFGIKLDHERHYNVSNGEADRTQISGNFIDCHDNTHDIRNQTHLNMFSNDFF